jgi:CBS domain-containing protein
MIVDPITLRPDNTLADAEAIMARYNISGVPMTDGGKLVGILTNRDVRFATDRTAPVTAYMTSREPDHRAGGHFVGGGARRFCTATASKSCRWWTTTATCAG